MATVTDAAITDVLSTGVDVAVGACTGSFLISILAAVVLDTLIPGVLGVSGVVGAEEVVGVETEFGLLLLPLWAEPVSSLSLNNKKRINYVTRFTRRAVVSPIQFGLLFGCECCKHESLAEYI